jgi:hypothetical protein
MYESNPKNRLWLTVAVLFGLGIVMLAAWLWHRETQRGVTPASKETAAKANASASTALPTPAAAESSKTRLQEFTAKLSAAPEAKAAQPQLTELRATLLALPTNEAVAEIRRFLDSKADAPTHLGFKIGRTGLLDEAPTLRTFLLDEMARLDPSAAGEYAKVILDSKDSPDEWAVALRNLARGDPSAEGRALLEEKAGELLRHEPWQREPSVGYLEAFDTAVFVGGTNLMTALADLVRRKDNQAVAHASFLTLDRLVINDSVATLTALQAAPDWMEGREETRANYFARGDVRDPEQRQILENYLADPQLSPAELDAFAGKFPNANFMISANLLTQNQTLDRAALVGRDVESLRVVQQWLADPRFAKQRPALERISRRLEEFVRQANPGK